MERVNVGCGPVPAPGWLNIDNSPSVALARLPAGLVRTFTLARLITPEQAAVVSAARRAKVRRASATNLPLDAGSAEAVYASHMLEHLDRDEAATFLSEAHRVLAPSGWLRLVVPDLDYHVRSYLDSHDADQFMDELLVVRPRLSGARRLAQAAFGFRGHRWMYDARSLVEFVKEAGFENVQVVPAGETNLPDPSGLDLRERELGSLYVEAQRP